MMRIEQVGMMDVLDFPVTGAFMRRCLLWQCRRSATFMVKRQGVVLALAMFMPLKKRLSEFALVLAPGAERHLVALVRVARLTLSKVVQNGIVVKAHVRESDASARRMARLAGFRPGRLKDGSVMIWRGGA